MKNLPCNSTSAMPSDNLTLSNKWQQVPSVTSLSRKFHLCIAGATHIRDFLQPMGLTAFRIFVSEPGHSRREIEELRRQRGGRVLADANDPHDVGTALADADEWFATPLSETMMEGAVLPGRIRIENDCIAFRLFEPAPLVVMQAAVHAMLQPRCLRSYLGSADGRERLAFAGHKTGSWFHTREAGSLAAGKRTPLTGMFLIRPRRELPPLANALSELLKALSTR